MGVGQGGKGRTFVILSTIKIKIHKIKPMEQENPHYYYKISTKTFSNYSLFMGLVSLLFMKYFQSVPEFPPVLLPPLLMSSVTHFSETLPNHTGILFVSGFATDISVSHNSVFPHCFTSSRAYLTFHSFRRTFLVIPFSYHGFL